jgi:hypothetical protein
MFEKILEMKVSASRMAAVFCVIGYLLGYGLSAIIIYWIIRDVVSFYQPHEAITAWSVLLTMAKVLLIGICLFVKTIFVKAAAKMIE